MEYTNWIYFHLLIWYTRTTLSTDCWSYFITVTYHFTPISFCLSSLNRAWSSVQLHHLLLWGERHLIPSQTGIEQFVLACERSSSNHELLWFSAWSNGRLIFRQLASSRRFLHVTCQVERKRILTHVSNICICESACLKNTEYAFIYFVRKKIPINRRLINAVCLIHSIWDHKSRPLKKSKR